MPYSLPPSQSGLSPNNQAQSQPIPPSQKSRYFRSGITDPPAPQGRGRLSLLPHVPCSPAAVGTSRSTRSPLEVQQQPHPFFVRNPAAMGFIPQQALSYSRHMDPQEPIVPLRQEFSIVRNIHDGEGAICSPALTQNRPYSVPSHHMQTSRSQIEYHTQGIPRPASVAHSGAQVRSSSSQPNVKMPPEGNGDMYNQAYQGEFMPAKRILPFLIDEESKTQNIDSKAHPESLCVEPSVLELSPAPTQRASQGTTVDSSGNMSKRQQKPPSEPVNSKDKGRSKRLNDASTDDLQPSKRPTKIKLVSRHANHVNRSSGQGCSVSILTRPDRDTPQDTKTSQVSLVSPVSQGNRLRNNERVLLDPSIGIMGATLIHGYSTQTSELPQVEIADVDQGLRAKNTFATCELVPRESQPDSTTPTPLNNSPTCARITANRSASQATTVSTTSIEPSQIVEDEHRLKPKATSNPMSTIDDTLLLEQDISDIVTACLREGITDSLDGVYGAILLKQAVRDEALLEMVTKML